MKKDRPYAKGTMARVTLYNEWYGIVAYFDGEFWITVHYYGPRGASTTDLHPVDQVSSIKVLRVIESTTPEETTYFKDKK